MIDLHPSFDRHELVTVRHHQASGLRAVIAIHNTRRGPAIGGCRILPYASFEDALGDALRLSRGMTYKTAIANIPYGGGKAVIVGDPGTIKSSDLLHAFGDFVESLGGEYITSFDSGTTLEDVRTIGERTRFAAGTLEAAGDAAQSTADGIYHCLRVGIATKLGRSSFTGLRAAIQGCGNVGARLARKLSREGVRLSLADIDEERARGLALAVGGEVVPSDTILSANVDVFSPCALGGVLSEHSIASIRAKIVCGAANNQLATPADARRLLEADILYCPDYLANAGGIIDLHYQRSGWSRVAVDTHVEGLADTFALLIERAAKSGRSVAEEADALVEERIHQPEPTP